MVFRNFAPTKEAFEELQKKNSELEQEISFLKEKEKNQTFLSLAKKVKDLTEELNRNSQNNDGMKAIFDLKTNKFEEEKKTLEKEIESLKHQNDLLKTKLFAPVEKFPEYRIFRKTEPELGGLDENPKPETLTATINSYAKRGFEVQQVNNVIGSGDRTEFIVLMVKKPT